MSNTSESAATLPHDNLQALSIALTFLFPAAATVSLALRLYSRSLTRTFALDDWVIGFAAVVYWALTIVSYRAIKIMYMGYHVWDIPKDFDKILGLKYLYAGEVLFNPILALVKTSILLFLLRLTGQKTAVKWSIWGLLILNGLMMVLTFILTACQCLPVQANWDRASYPDAKCLNFADFVTGTAAVSVLTDVLVLLLPTWIVYDLKIQKRQKLMLIGILSFGLVTVITGIVRIVILDRFDRNPGTDSSYSIIYCLSTFEIGLSFIAACAPSLKPIIAKFVPKIFSSQSAARYTKGGPGKPTKLGSGRYQLDRMTRKTEMGHTRIEGGDDVVDDGADDGIFKHAQGSKDCIVMTMETEVRWDETEVASTEKGKSGSSMESLV